MEFEESMHEFFALVPRQKLRTVPAALLVEFAHLFADTNRLSCEPQQIPQKDSQIASHAH